MNFNRLSLLGKTAEEKEKFLKWYEEERRNLGGQYSFREQIMSYCANDVTVLRLCALKFRQDFISLCNIDPFHSVTIASACQKYYRTYLMEENTIGVTSQHGYMATGSTAWSRLSGWSG